MRSQADIDAVLDLACTGRSAHAISRETTIPVTTVRRWMHGRVPNPPARFEITSLPAPEYSYLLGLYLGDGHIAAWRKGLWHLRISCDGAYPDIVAAAKEAIAAVRGPAAITTRSIPDSRCLLVQSLWRHWPEAFPQHGPGRKHTRVIRLTEWQEEIVGRAREALVRGLIHSDGSRYVARQRSSNGKIYTYPRYGFSNRSGDIRDLLCAQLDALGISWTQPGPYDIAIARRADVAAVDAFVGPKR